MIVKRPGRHPELSRCGILVYAGVAHAPASLSRVPRHSKKEGTGARSALDLARAGTETR